MVPSSRVLRGAEGSQDCSFVDALELRHRDGAYQDQNATRQCNPADDGDRERHVVEDGLDRGHDLRTSMAETFGNWATRSRWNVARAVASSGARRIAM